MSLIDDLVKLEEEAKELVAGADDAAKLEAARVELLGRKGRITGLMRMMGKLAPEDRPVMGKRANEMRQLIEGMLDERTTEMKAAALKHALEHEAVDITLPGIRPQIGHQHLIKQIIEEAEDIHAHPEATAVLAERVNAATAKTEEHKRAVANLAEEERIVRERTQPSRRMFYAVIIAAIAIVVIAIVIFVMQ